MCVTQASKGGALIDFLSETAHDFLEEKMVVGATAEQGVCVWPG